MFHEESHRAMQVLDNRSAAMKFAGEDGDETQGGCGAAAGKGRP